MLLAAGPLPRRQPWTPGSTSTRCACVLRTCATHAATIAGHGSLATNECE